MKKHTLALAAVLVLALLAGSRSEPLPLLAVPLEYEMVPTSEGLDDFLALGPEIPASYPGDSFVNVTPEFVKENSEFRVFKCKDSCYSVLQYQNALYSLAPWFGGFGLTSLALADLNEDGAYELYFTGSSGSGLHRAEIGYFDPAQKKTTLFQETYLYSDLVLTDSDGVLTISTAALNAPSFTELQAVKEQEIACLEFRGNTVEVNREGWEDPEKLWDIIPADES